MRSGVRIGIDVGKVRIGVATSDHDGLLATPLATIQRLDDNWLQELTELALEQGVFEFIVGLPLSLSGTHTPSTEDALAVAELLHTKTGVTCRLVDERFSTSTALKSMASAGKSQKQSRAFIDQVAAVNILQHALDSEKNTGAPAGTLLSQFTR